MTTINKTALGLLAAIAAATDSPAGCDYVVTNAPAVKALIDGAYIETNASLTNDKGEVAARVSQSGRDLLANGGSDSGQDASGGESGNRVNTDAAAAGAPATGKKRSFVIEDDVPLVPRTRQRTSELYPFSDLQIGQSFFVANDDVSSGNAVKTLTSTVNTANDKYSVETGETRPHKRDATKTVAVKRAERKFELRPYTQHDGTKGARVYRVEIDAE